MNVETKAAQRFATKYAVAESGCWEWSGFLNNCGYGQFWLKGRHEYAHRAAWMLHHGCVPCGQCVCHRCDNPACVNPDHLFLATHDENMADMTRKGRQPTSPGARRMDISGVRNGSAKLDEGKVLIIRQMVGQGHPLAPLARRYGVSYATVQKAASGETWRHVGAPA